MFTLFYYFLIAILAECKKIIDGFRENFEIEIMGLKFKIKQKYGV